MPRIPTVQADESIMGPAPAREMGAEKFGAATGQALEQLGNDVTNAEFKLHDINQEVQGRKAITDATSELNNYQQELKTGPMNPDGSLQIDESTGLPVGPPPPEKHAELMQQKIDEIRQKTAGQFGTFDGQANRMFSANFDQYANTQLLETKVHAVSLLNQKIVSQFQLDLQQRANLAVSSDPLVRHTSENETEQYIDRMVKSGVLTPEEGFRLKENYVEQVELGSIRNILKSPLRADGSSGATDVIRAIDAGEFNGLKPEVLQRQRNIALDQQHTNETRSIQATEFAQHQQEHQQKIADENTSRQMTTLLAQRKLTPSIVAQNAGKLSPASYLMFTKAAAGGDLLPSDASTKFSLANRIFNGEDVTQDLNSAAQAGALSPTDYIELRQKQNEYTGTMKGNPAAKASMDWIHGQMGGDSLTKLPAQNAAEANVKRAFQDYVQQNPKATPDQLRDQAEALVRRGSIVDKSEMTTSLLSPRFYGGSKADLMSGSAPPDSLANAYAATVSAYKDGKISELEMKREKALIATWDRLTPKPTPVKK